MSEVAPEDELHMREALAEAELSARVGEVPVGAVAVMNGVVIARAHNLRETDQDPTAHAEMIVLREVARQLGSWRLLGVTLYVTLEPCPMCAGLILMSRVGRVIYGARSDKWGAAGSKLDLLGGGHFPVKPEVIGGVLAEEGAAILAKYFAQRRAGAGRND